MSNGICQNCGRSQDQSVMPDWSICAPCHSMQVAAMYPEGTFIDELGIPWTPEEIDKEGGISEIRKLNREARVI